jgi:predicted aminopeptidase
MIARLPVILVALYLLTACSGPGYYMQAISGQWKLMRSREEIQALLDNPETSPELAAQLQSASRIKVFAEAVLDLPGDGSYSSYVEVGGSALVWNVIATPEFSLQAKQWCFPVAGCVPYRGYFDQHKANDSADRLRRKGMDVHVSPAAAYSSLGWFEDPLLSTMLSGSDTRLAAYLFHALAHQRLYIKGDGAFNEGYASFVEQAGVKIWLESQQRDSDLLEWQQLRQARRDVAALIDNIRAELNALYLSSHPEATKRKQKAEILDSLSNSHEQLVEGKWAGNRYFNSWFKEPVNNAKLALFNTYQGSNCGFQELLDKADGNMKEFHRLAGQVSGLPGTDREKWLNQPCMSQENHDPEV